MGTIWIIFQEATKKRELPKGIFYYFDQINFCLIMKKSVSLGKSREATQTTLNASYQL